MGIRIPWANVPAAVKADLQVYLMVTDGTTPQYKKLVEGTDHTNDGSTIRLTRSIREIFAMDSVQRASQTAYRVALVSKTKAVQHVWNDGTDDFVWDSLMEWNSESVFENFAGEQTFGVTYVDGLDVGSPVYDPATDTIEVTFN